MTQLLILCVEDESEVRDALVRDLEPFATVFQIEPSEDVADARQVVEEHLAARGRLALALCDHVMPGTSGVDFLVELNGNPATAKARKVLVTGQAGLEDTVKAVNRADLDHYIAKPWSIEELHTIVRRQLTQFVIEEVEDLLPFVQILDGPSLLAALRNRKEQE